MLLEIIGCTGAGKSTFARMLLEELSARGLAAAEANDSTLPRLLAPATYPVRSLALHLIAFHALLTSSSAALRFCPFAARMLLKYERSPRVMANFYRNVLKRMGLYQVLRKRRPRGTIVFDEGTVHTAHTLFVHLSCTAHPCDITRFSQVVPLPDKVVFVRAPLEVLLDRTLTRPRRSLIIAKQSNSVIRAYLARAIDVYEQLTSVDRIRERLLVVDQDQGDGRALGAAARGIAESLARRTAVDNPA